METEIGGRVFIQLIMDCTDNAPDGPGWYICVYRNDKQLLPPVAMTSHAASTIASAFDNSLGNTLPSSIESLVTQCDKIIHDSLVEQLKIAESQAVRIATLRRKLSLITPPADDHNPEVADDPGAEIMDTHQYIDDKDDNAV